jgi:tRNA pseudouridine55 synthase
VKPGFLVIDKPPGLTSHDIVGIVRAVTGVKKVGHTGTLDPFATGVLPLALGASTRLIQYLDENHKVYDATITLGTRMDTGDLTGEPVAEARIPTLEAEAVQTVLDGFVGDRLQRPPRYSAVKVAGKRLYEYARAGKDVEIKARPVRIDGIDLIEFGEGWLRVRITCGRGTYARVLGEEIAVELGSEGHLTALRRERSGPFDLVGSLDLNTLAETVGGVADWGVVLRTPRGVERSPWRPRDDVRAALTERLLSPKRALFHLPCIDIPAPIALRIRQGGVPPGPPEGWVEGGRWILACDNELVAVAEVREGKPRSARVVPAR